MFEYRQPDLLTYLLFDAQLSGEGLLPICRTQVFHHRISMSLITR